MTNSTNGVKIPVWAISLIVLLLGNLVMFAVSFATLKADLKHTNSNIVEIKDGVAETKFEVGNISDGIADLRNENTRFDEKCNEYDRRLGVLEDQ